MKFINEFFERGRFVRSLNSTFLVLIPKYKGVEDLKDFRPICLVGSLYKLLAKVLANRLNKVMNNLVNKAQNAFVEGKKILDAFLAANEIIGSIVKKKDGGVLCKLDIEKAYDHINWSFLLKVLHKMGFGIKWVKWIRWCIFTPSFSVLVNGSSTGFLKSSRGLKQGDPLSPYLFVLGMEALSILLDKAVCGGYISGHTFKGRNGSEVTISHLLFVDNTLIFCKDSVDQLSFLGWTLAWFEALLGV